MGKLAELATSVMPLSFANLAAHGMLIHAADTVIVNGTQWAQPSLFTNLSWNDINAQCPGGVSSATSVLNNWSLDGWTWATAAEVGGLFEAVTPHPGGVEIYTEDGANWATDFFSKLGFEPTKAAPDTRTMVAGWTSNAGTFGPFSSHGEARVARSHDPGFGPNEVRTELFSLFPDRTTEWTGAWFFRPADTVPEPSTLDLLALASSGLFGRRHKRSQKTKGP